MEPLDLHFCATCLYAKHCPFTWKPSSGANLCLEPLLLLFLGTIETLLRTLTRNLLCLKPWNLLHPLLGTLTFNLGTFQNLYLEPLLGTFLNLYLEPLLGTFLNLYLEPLLGTSEHRGMTAPVPHGLVWLRPQSFQLLGKNDTNSAEEGELEQL